MAPFKSPMNNGRAEQPDPSRGVFVRQEEYNRLVQVDRLYANLTRNLRAQGISDEQIALMSGDVVEEDSSETAVPSPARLLHQVSDEDLLTHARLLMASSTAGPTPPKTGESADKGYGKKLASEATSSRGSPPLGLPKGWADLDSETASFTTESFSVSERVLSHLWPATPSPAPDRSHKRDSFTPAEPEERVNHNRTVQIFGVPAEATLADVTATIRGGMLLEIYKLKAPVGTYEVSFVYPEDAADFHGNYAHSDVLYVMGKRVGVRWADRQAPLTASARRQVHWGGTRNLLVSSCGCTEKSVRDDLEHIHRLEVLRVEVRGRNCFIETNSIELAQVARTCMQSRLKYKGCYFKWAADECAESLGTEPTMSSRGQLAATLALRQPSASPSLNPRANRFDTLSKFNGDKAP